MEADDYVPLSGLQHLVFCPRQAALIHVEQIWADDAATTAGTLLHERADEPGAKIRAGIRIARAVPLISERLRVRGKADMVELHRDTTAPKGLRPIPVEMKRGKAKHRRADEVQLCAQAICLEEMHGVEIHQAWLSYDGSHRRLEVALDDALRSETAQAAAELHSLLREGRVPAAVFEERKCSRCSLIERCLPRVTGDGAGSGRELERIRREAE